jgi:hypothetical protein
MPAQGFVLGGVVYIIRYAKEKLMKAILLPVLFLLSFGAFAKPINCKNTPTDAVIEFSSPINNWAVIFCSPAGHAIAPIDGYLWLAPNGKPFMFQAASLMNSPPLEDSNSAYFNAVAHRKLEGQFKTNVNLMLVKAGQQEDQSLQPWQLDIKSNKGILYNLFFYEKKW